MENIQTINRQQNPDNKWNQFAQHESSNEEVAHIVDNQANDGELFKFTKKIVNDPEWQEQYRKHQTARKIARERVAKIDDPQAVVRNVQNSIRRKVESGEINSDNLNAATSAMDVLIDAFGSAGKMTEQEATEARELWQQELNHMNHATPTVQRSEASSREPILESLRHTTDEGEVDSQATQERETSREAGVSIAPSVRERVMAFKEAKEATLKARDVVNSKTDGTPEKGWAGEEYDKRKAIYEQIRDDSGEAIVEAYNEHHSPELRAAKEAYEHYQQSAKAAERAKEELLNYDSSDIERKRELKEISDRKSSRYQGALREYEAQLLALEGNQESTHLTNSELRRLVNEPIPDNKDDMDRRIATLKAEIARQRAGKIS